MRITKEERKKNANQFYNMFMNGSCGEAAIVAQKCVSTNPNINKIQFMAVPSSVSYGTPVVIAESNFGLTGCFAELLQNIYPGIPQEKSYFDDGFNDNNPCTNLRPTKSLGVREPVKAWLSEIWNKSGAYVPLSL